MGHKKLLETNDDVMLQQKLQLRAPYITPLNILQVSASSASIATHEPAAAVHANCSTWKHELHSKFANSLHSPRDLAFYSLVAQGSLRFCAGECKPVCFWVQVYCLKALRAMESGQGIDSAYKDYKPDDPAVQARSLSQSYAAGGCLCHRWSAGCMPACTE